MTPNHPDEYIVWRIAEAALLIHMGCQLRRITFTQRGDLRFHFNEQHRADHELMKARIYELNQRVQRERERQGDRRQASELGHKLLDAIEEQQGQPA